MRHLKSMRKLGRRSDQRRALLRNMATSLIETGRMVTTVPKAKELRRVVEKIVTRGKEDNLQNRRLVASYLFKKTAVQKLFSDLGVRYKDRNGGYTRIIKHGPRFGDGAEMCAIEFLA